MTALIYFFAAGLVSDPAILMLPGIAVTQEAVVVAHDLGSPLPEVLCGLNV